MTNLMDYAAKYYSKEIKDFGITEIFIADEDGDVHVTSMYDIPESLIERLQCSFNGFMK